jgi:hypothetical protein
LWFSYAVFPKSQRIIFACFLFDRLKGAIGHYSVETCRGGEILNKDLVTRSDKIFIVISILLFDGTEFHFDFFPLRGLLIIRSRRFDVKSGVGGINGFFYDKFICPSKAKIVWELESGAGVDDPD